MLYTFILYINTLFIYNISILYLIHVYDINVWLVLSPGNAKTALIWLEMFHDLTQLAAKRFGIYNTCIYNINIYNNTYVIYIFM